MRSIVSKEDDPAKSLQSLESADEAIYLKFLTTSCNKVTEATLGLLGML